VEFRSTAEPAGYFILASAPNFVSQDVGRICDSHLAVGMVSSSARSGQTSPRNSLHVPSRPANRVTFQAWQWPQLLSESGSRRRQVCATAMTSQPPPPPYDAEPDCFTLICSARVLVCRCEGSLLAHTSRIQRSDHLFSKPSHQIHVLTETLQPAMSMPRYDGPVRLEGPNINLRASRGSLVPSKRFQKYSKSHSPSTSRSISPATSTASSPSLSATSPPTSPTTGNTTTDFGSGVLHLDPCADAEPMDSEQPYIHPASYHADLVLRNGITFVAGDEKWLDLTMAEALFLTSSASLRTPTTIGTRSDDEPALS
jgi:hypothetical protein